jgi:hypothetical protein
LLAFLLSLFVPSMGVAIGGAAISTAGWLPIIAAIVGGFIGNRIGIGREYRALKRERL